MSTTKSTVRLTETQKQQEDTNAELTAIGTPCKKQTRHKLTLFEHIVQLGTLHEQAGGKPETVFKLAKKHIDFVSKKLDLMPLQTVLFADLLYVSDGEYVTMQNLAAQMKCKPVEIFAYHDQFETLERKSFIEISTETKSCSRSTSVRIPFQTLQAIQNGERPVNQWLQVLSPLEFMERAMALCEERICDTGVYERLLKNLGFLLEGNAQLEFVETVRSYALYIDDVFLLLQFCVHHFLYDAEEIEMSDLERRYRIRSLFSKTKSDLRRNRHPLQEKGIIEYVNQNGFSQQDFFRLTETAKEKLLLEQDNPVVGKRMELGESRSGPSQTENAIQNIILQEMENLYGILIATTNLSINMDKAFERRFLYKIEFDQPTLEARKSIWQTMLPDLPNEDAVTLAARFDFSGGQIENITRRSAVSQVLHGHFPTLEQLITFCQEEQGDCDTAKRIGFV